MKDWTDPWTEKKMETRIITDVNGFKKEQIRFLPVEPWEPNDGWRTRKILESHKA